MQNVIKIASWKAKVSSLLEDVACSCCESVFDLRKEEKYFYLGLYLFA